MKKHLLFSLLLLLLVSTVVRADKLSEGYAAFKANDFKQAYEHFKKAALLPETKAEANLMMALMSTTYKDELTAFSYFMEFYRSSENPDMYLTALFNHALFNGFRSVKPKEEIIFFTELLNRNDLQPTLKAYLLEAMGKYYESMGDIKKSREYLAQIGAVKEWQIVGDFENISASGFDKEFGPLSQPEPDAIFKNKIGAPVKWFPLCHQIDGKWIDLTYNFYCNNTLVYAQTFCNSETDQLVQLRLGTSGSLKVWVNDQLVFSEIEERNNGMDTYVFPVQLSKGNNRILIKIGCSKITNCNYMMRVTDMKGSLIPNLKFASTYSPYEKRKQEIPSLIEQPFEAFLLKQIEKHPEKLVNHIALATTYLMNDKTHNASDILLKAITETPNCSAILYQLSELQLRKQDRTSYSMVTERIKMNDPDNPIVLNLLMNDAFEAKNYQEVKRLIEHKESLYGESKDLMSYKLKMFATEEKIPAYEALLKRIIALDPSDYSMVELKFNLERDYKNDQKSAMKTLSGYNKSYFDKDARQDFSDALVQSGKTQEGIDIIKQLNSYFPFNDNYYQQLGWFYLQSGQYSLAKSNFEECIRIAPYYGRYHGYYARVFAETKETDKAIAEYTEDLRYSPDDYESIKKLRELQNKKEVFDLFPQKDHYKLFAESPSVSKYPNDNFLSLNEERQIVLYGNGGSEIRQLILLKALTLKGIDYLKEYNVPCGSDEDYLIEKAEVLKKNGNRLQAEVSNNQVVFTSLEPGDGIFLIYRITQQVSGQMSKHYSEKLLLTNWYPSLNIEYGLLIDKKFPFKYTVERSDVKPTVTDVDDFTFYNWKKGNDSSIKPESYRPPLADIGETLTISTIPSWDYISKWYFDISNTKTKPEAEVKEVVDSLLRGKENLLQYEKAQILYNFMEQNIRYSSVSFRQNGIVPQKATDVLLTRIGDCKDVSVLFTSMCKAAGIEAEIVLVMRRENGTSWTALPSFEFDHAIAKATLDGKDYYIELTSSYFPFATLGQGLLGSVILNVNNDPGVKAEPFKLYSETRSPNTIYWESNVTFDGDNMNCTSKTISTGAQAASIRSNYRDKGKEERESTFLKSIASNYSNMKLNELEFSPSISDCSDSVLYNYSFSAPNVFSRFNNLMIVKLPLTVRYTPFGFLAPSERSFPIEAWKYSTFDTVSEKVTVVAPAGKKLVEVPKSVRFSCNQADYSLTFSLKGDDTLEIERKLTGKLDYVPVSDYSSYRSFIESVVNADSQQIGFK